MRRFARSSLLVLVSQLLIYCPQVMAQGAPGADTLPPVIGSEKSVTTAALLEAFTVPTLGYAYAGSWARGLPSAAVQLLGVGLALEQQLCLCFFEEPPPCVGRCVVGIALAVGARVWAIIDASLTVKRNNAGGQGTISALRMLPMLGQNGAGLGVPIPTRW